MNNRQKQKEDSKQAKRYLKAKFKEKFGFLFIAIWYFLRNNFLYHKKKIGIIMFVISVILLIFTTINLLEASKVQNKTNNYDKSNLKYNKQITAKRNQINKQNDKIEKFSISSSPKIVKASEILSQVFNGMYDYTDSSEYQKNRDKNLKYFANPESDDVENIYNADVDSSGDSIIENLNLSSSLLEYNLFTDKIDTGNSDKLNFNAVVKYQSNILGVSSDYSSRTHTNVYNIDFDTKKNKITNIKKVDTLKEDKSIE